MRSALACLLCATLAVVASAQTTILSWQMPPIPKASCTGPGDLNGDGIPDVVLGAGGCLKAWSGFDGTLLWQACDTAAGLGDSVAAAGDLDFDGRSEIVAAAPGSGTTSGYTSIRSGATGAVVRTIPVATLTVDGGRDFDGDGVPDQLGTFSLATGQAGVHVFSGTTGAIIFTMDDAWCACAATLHASFLPDVNGDGFDDLVAGYFVDVITPGTVAVAKGPMGGLHALITNVFMTASERCVADVGDLTGDGQHEIGVCRSFPPVLYAYDLGAGGLLSAALPLWAFAPSLVVHSFGNPAPVGDVDGDGRTDLVVSATTGLSPASQQHPLQYVVSGATGGLITSSTPGIVFPPVDVNFVARVGDVNVDGTPEYLHVISTPTSSLVLTVHSCTPLPAPSALDLGGACGAVLTNLFVSPLRIGFPLGINVFGGPPNAQVDLVFDVAPPAPLTFAGCTWHPDLAHIATWFVMPLMLSVGGSALASIPIPAIPILAGTTVTTQAIVYGTLSPFGFDLSNGLLSVAGF